MATQRRLTVYCTLFVLLVCTAVHAQVVRPAFLDSTYRITFRDEFTGNRLNYTKWDLRYPLNQSANDEVCLCECGTPQALLGHKAYRIWQNDTSNIELKDGTIKLIVKNVKKEPFMGEFWDWPTDENGKTVFSKTFHPVDYTSAMLYSKKSFWRGYYEIKFKLPKAAEFFKTYAPFGANFWLQTGDCPTGYQEIDGFEIVNGQTREYTMNIHYAPPLKTDTVCSIFTNPGYKSDFKNYGTITDGEWHVAGFNWMANRVDFYLDGALVHSSAIAGIDSMRPMNMFIDINAPKENCSSLESPLTKFPYVYEIDYVRVWTRKEDEAHPGMK